MYQLKRACLSLAFAALLASGITGCATEAYVGTSGSAEKAAQKVRTPYLPGWDQVPNERLERQAAKYRGTYYLEGLHRTMTIPRSKACEPSG